jgi:hypothetical protein
MLAGWQALDLRNAKQSWQCYERAKAAASESNSEAFVAHAAAQQAFVLIDVDRSAEAVALVAQARERAAKSSPTVLRSWLAAAHGEALAANMDHSASLRAFDDAAYLLSVDAVPATEGPYIVLDQVHFDRWRGHALARLADSSAIEILNNALDRLDPSFARAETGLRVDLATVLNAVGERREAMIQAKRAEQLASLIGSARQRRRVSALSKLIA